MENTQTDQYHWLMMKMKMLRGISIDDDGAGVELRPILSRGSLDMRLKHGTITIHVLD